MKSCQLIFRIKQENTRNIIRNLAVLVILIGVMGTVFMNCLGESNQGDVIKSSDEKTIKISWAFENENKRTAAAKEPPDTSRYTADTGEGIIDLIGARFGPPHYFTQGAGGKGTYAAHSDSWNNGSGKKYWQITISTRGYKNLKLSSRQRGSKTGPRDFKVQFSIDGANWEDIPKATLTISENFTSGFLNEVPLPKLCEEKQTLYLRWIMTSNTSIDRGVVGKQGTNRIDDILIIGS